MLERHVLCALVMIALHLPGAASASPNAVADLGTLGGAVAKPMGITLHDHIIVGRNGHASFKGLKLI